MTGKDSRISEVEGRVLAVYTEENPSTRFLEEDSAFRRRERQMIHMFRDKLHFPPKMFSGCDLLDFGAGTGENVVFPAIWGARCTLVEMNPKAIARAERIFSVRAPDPSQHTFDNRSLFDYDGDRQFDIVYSHGVLQHTAAKRKGFLKLASHLKPGGYAFLGIGPKVGFFQRALQRHLIWQFATDHEGIVEVAEALFGPHLDRAERLGGRTRRAIIYDTYVLPQLDNASTAEVLEWFTAAGLRLYSCWPPMMPALMGDSSTRPITFDLRAWPQATVLSEIVTMLQNADDGDMAAETFAGWGEAHEALEAVTSLVNDKDSGDLSVFSSVVEGLRTLSGRVGAIDVVAPLVRRLDDFTREVEQVRKAAARRDLAGTAAAIAECRLLFQGAAGLGLAHYMGYKPLPEELG
jgi:SAM-dependent methyltransferase